RAELEAVVAAQLKRLTPLALREMERSRGLVWTSLPRIAALTHSASPLLVRFGLFALQSAALADYHAAQLSARELDWLCALQWHSDAAVVASSRALLSTLRIHTELSSPPSVPSLTALALVRVQRAQGGRVHALSARLGLHCTDADAEAAQRVLAA